MGIQDRGELPEEARAAYFADDLLDEPAELAMRLRFLGRDGPKPGQEVIRPGEIPLLQGQLDEFLERGRRLEEAGRLLLRGQDRRNDLEHLVEKGALFLDPDRVGQLLGFRFA